MKDDQRRGDSHPELSLCEKQREFQEQIRLGEEEIVAAEEKLFEAINDVLHLNSGVLGFIVRAILGVRAPTVYARRIDLLECKLENLNKRQTEYKRMFSEASLLASRAERTSDRSNRTSLERRAVYTLDAPFDSSPLEKAEEELLQLTGELEETAQSRNLTEEGIDELRKKAEAFFSVVRTRSVYLTEQFLQLLRDRGLLRNATGDADS